MSSPLSFARSSPVPPPRQETGPNGRRLCLCGCGREVTKGSRKYYSADCMIDVHVRHNPGLARFYVKQRDHGICALCGRNCERLNRQADGNLRLCALKSWIINRYFKSSREVRIKWHAWLERVEPLVNTKAKALHSRLIREGFSYRMSFWQCDHIIPVIEGGGHCGLDGLRTLCTRCHRKVTADLRKRLALNRSTNLEQMTLIP